MKKRKVAVGCVCGLVFLSSCGKGSTNQKKSGIEELSSDFEQVIDQVEESNAEIEESYYSYLDTVDRTKVKDRSVISCFVNDLSDAKNLQEFSTNIFLAKVSSIDKADVLVPAEGEIGSDLPYTFGKLRVIKDIEGVAEENSLFARSGGIIQEKERVKYASVEEIDIYIIA